jgi:hypothetical protein
VSAGSIHSRTPISLKFLGGAALNDGYGAVAGAGEDGRAMTSSLPGACRTRTGSCPRDVLMSGWGVSKRWATAPYQAA